MSKGHHEWPACLRNSRKGRWDRFELQTRFRLVTISGLETLQVSSDVIAQRRADSHEELMDTLALARVSRVLHKRSSEQLLALSVPHLQHGARRFARTRATQKKSIADIANEGVLFLIDTQLVSERDVVIFAAGVVEDVNSDFG